MELMELTGRWDHRDQQDHREWQDHRDRREFLVLLIRVFQR
jgi:hypothetical protein